MPHADTAETARRWATARAIDLWVIFEGDLDAETLRTLGPGLEGARSDGGRVAVVAPSGCEPTSGETAIADLIVSGPRPPSPYGLFTALQAAGLDDVRRVGVIGRSVSALGAGHRAGAGAIVGLAAGTDGAVRRDLAAGAPDLIVAADAFGEADRDRWGSARTRRELVLLNPGPSVTSDRVHRAIAGEDLCHREPEYVELFTSVRTKLLRVAGVGDDWAVVLIAGSGTAAMEAMTGAFVRPGRRLLVCQNGVYGDRIATIANRLGIGVLSVSAPHTTPIDPRAVQDALESNPDIDAVAVVHHETTTGLLNPVAEIAGVADAHGALLITDAISSFGAETLEFGRGIDVVAGTSNKCLHGLPGVAFIIVSPRAQARAEEVPPHSLYFDIPNYLRAQRQGTVPFTPAVPATYALDAALDELFDEGLERRREHYAERAAFLDREFARLGLEPIVAAQHRSHSVRSLPLPSGIAYGPLHDAVKKDGYVIYAGLGQAAATNFRVCALGNLEVPALDGFIASLERAITTLAPPTTSQPTASQPAAPVG